MPVVTNSPGQSAGGSANRFAARRVAIRLRGLAVADRNWILDQLDAGQRRAVEVAEAELQHIMGNEVLDFSLFLEEMDKPEKQRARACESHAINALDSEKLRVVLDRLPTVWVKALLDSGIWSEGEKYRERLPVKHRQRLKKTAAASLPPRVVSALADSLVEVVRESGAHHG